MLHRTMVGFWVKGIVEGIINEIINEIIKGSLDYRTFVSFCQQF